jgi:hypothetical protein
MDMSKVFVVQQQFRYDPDTGQNVPRFPTMENAKSLGELVFLLGPNAHPFSQSSVSATLHHYLNEFCDEDYLILTGNPILLGMATAIAANYNSGKVNFLQWSPKEERYIVVQSAMF